MPLSWGPLVIFTPPTARILPAGTWPWPGHGRGSVGTAARGTPTSQAGTHVTPGAPPRPWKRAGPTADPGLSRTWLEGAVCLAGDQTGEAGKSEAQDARARASMREGGGQPKARFHWGTESLSPLLVC